ncbi:MAG: class E sortase [Candidatus Staskawiczbacteria bacterium]|nr:class E sortase [Candidatus Staskawiczbacteria bacterium]
MKRDQKKIFKFFVTIYLVSFTIINWNDISWIFNYREVSGLLYDFFTPYQSISAYSTSDVFVNNSANYLNTNNDNAKQAEYPDSLKTNILEIPSIGISTVVVLPQNPSIEAVTKDLDKGVVYYPGSVFPGVNGQIVILGHSAPPNWPKIKHDWVFTDLNSLKYGDEIHLYFNYKEYVYSVREKKIIAKGQEITPTPLVENGNVLVLVSCWPPGKNLQRIAVQAELIN